MGKVVGGPVAGGGVGSGAASLLDDAHAMLPHARRAASGGPSAGQWPPALRRVAPPTPPIPVARVRGGPRAPVRACAPRRPPARPHPTRPLALNSPAPPAADSRAASRAGTGCSRRVAASAARAASASALPPCGATAARWSRATSCRARVSRLASMARDWCRGGGGGGLPPRRGRQVGMSAPPPPPAAPLGRNARRGGHDARGRRRLAHHATPSPPPRSGTSVATSREVGTPRGHIPCLLISLLGRRMIAVRVSQTERLDAHPLQPRPNPTPSLSQYRRTSWARKKARSTPERWAGLSPPPAASDAAAAAAVVATTRSASPAGARARPTWWEGRAGGA